MIHAAAKGVKTGQVTVKLVFDVEDVSAFCERSACNGLVFSSLHPADGYSYANGKDPCGNNIQGDQPCFPQGGLRLGGIPSTTLAELNLGSFGI